MLRNPKTEPIVSSQNDLVKDALIHLFACCDGASSVDGKGFNKLDAPACNEWARSLLKGEELSPADYYQAFNRIRKYRSQLKKAGLQLPKAWQIEYSHRQLQPGVWEVANLSRDSAYKVEECENELLCECEAASFGAECGHVRYLRKQKLNQVLEMQPRTIAVSTPIQITEGDRMVVGDITLTPAQSQALLGLEEWLQSGETFACLTGFAGSGKTTVLQALLKRMRNRGDKRSVAFSAFSNKATKVLARMAKSWNLQVDCMTCCKLLGLRPRIDHETGAQDFAPDPTETPKADDYDLIVVDECSMIGEAMWEFLSDSVSGLLSGKMLFVGDPAQLNPVNERRSPSFELIDRTFHLSEVVRYDGAIAGWAEHVRNYITRVAFPGFETDITPDKEKGVVMCDRARWEKFLTAAFRSETYQRDPDSVRAIAYTNARVLELNKLIRTVLYGECPQYFEGQRVIAQECCVDAEEVIWPTSSEGEITSATIGSTRLFNQDFKVWRVTVRDDSKLISLRCLHSDDEPQLQKLLKQLSEKKRWQEFWQLKQFFHDLRDAYCLTAHKAQGSTFKDVFVDLPNLQRCRNTQERNRLLYVAMTRPTHRVFFLNA